MSYPPATFVANATPDETATVLRFTYLDSDSQPMRVSGFLKQTVTNTIITTFLSNLQRLVNSRIYDVQIEDHTIFKVITSSAGPFVGVSAVEDLISAIQLIELEAQNPLKNGKVHESFPLPAFDRAKVFTAGSKILNTADTDVAAVITFLETYLGFRYSGDGLLYYPIWTVLNGLAASKGDGSAITVPDIIDNK